MGVVLGLPLGATLGAFEGKLLGTELGGVEEEGTELGFDDRLFT